MTKDIKKKIFIPKSREEVWEALTNPVDISAWLMQTTDFKPEVKSTFMMQAKPMPGWDGKIYGEILVADKPNVLSYTWKGDQMKSNTVIKWTLLPKDTGTLLILDHSGFTGLSDYILGIFHALGWKRFMNQLKNLTQKK
jgi:uncharacterized protein YndB with AHSA1/START domain